MKGEKLPDPISTLRLFVKGFEGGMLSGACLSVAYENAKKIIEAKDRRRNAKG